MTRFTFPHSHAFPGSRVGIEDDADAGPGCLVEFGDGVVVMAEWRRTNHGFDLSLPAYRTARGTEVAARSWRLVQRADGVWRSERTP